MQYASKNKVLDFLSIKYGKENFNNSNTISNVDKQNNLNNNTKQIIEQNLPTNFMDMPTKNIIDSSINNIAQQVQEYQDQNLNILYPILIKQIITLIYDRQPNRNVSIDELIYLSLKQTPDDFVNMTIEELITYFVEQHLSEQDNKNVRRIVDEIKQNVINGLPGHIRHKINPPILNQYINMLEREVSRQLNSNDSNLQPNNNDYNTNLITITPPETNLAPYVEIFPKIYKHKSQNIYYYYDTNSGILSDIEYPSTKPDMLVSDVVDLLEKHQISQEQIEQVGDLIEEELCEIQNNNNNNNNNNTNNTNIDKTEGDKQNNIGSRLHKALNKGYEVCPEKKSFLDIFVYNIVRYRVTLGMTTLLIVLLIVILIQMTNVKK